MKYSNRTVIYNVRNEGQTVTTATINVSVKLWGIVYTALLVVVVESYNTFYVLTGDHLLKALENGVSQYPKLEGRFPQVQNMCDFLL